MNYDPAWGHLGKPPKAVRNGTHPNMEGYRDYQKKIAGALKLSSARNRAIKIAEIRAQYLRDFPPDGDKE